MADEAQPSRASTIMFWIGWALTALPVLGLVFSCVLKLMKVQDVVKEFDRFGYNENLILPIGILELVCTVIYVIPRTAVLGAILLTGYLGGAVATHVRIDDPFIPPIAMGVLLWVALFLRDPRLRALLLQPR